MGRLSLSKTACIVFALCAATAIAAPAQTFETLISFDGSNGTDPDFISLIQGTNGSFYGTTCCGPVYGNVFSINPRGTLTALLTFEYSDGAQPYAGLVQAGNGSFYGTTNGGGANGGGTVFEITPKGTLTTLYSFCSQTNCADGANPWAGLIQATNGDFYGTTAGGGAYEANCGSSGCGTIFKITPGGKLTTLYSFCSQTGCTDGNGPLAALVQAVNGGFYGTTSNGGANNKGTVFKITAGGTLTTLYSFCSQTNCADGANPWAGLIQATNGDFYGTTHGAPNFCYPDGCGTVYKITSGGTLTTLYSFCSQTNCADGANPTAGLVQATDRNFYGMTWGGGANDDGTIFKLSPAGKLTPLHSFDGNDGESPHGGLVQATSGDFYGTATAGGANGYGTVFSLSVGLGPFVETHPTSGNVGAAVKILGTDLTGATSVTFNGTAAVFKVESKSLIKTTVPTGATTGTVEVTTPKATLKSNVVFRVTQ